MCVCLSWCAPQSRRSLRRSEEPLELELWETVSHHAGAGNRARSSTRAARALSAGAPPQPCFLPRTSHWPGTCQRSWGSRPVALHEPSTSAFLVLGLQTLCVRMCTLTWQPEVNVSHFLNHSPPYWCVYVYMRVHVWECVCVCVCVQVKSF